MNNIAIIWTPDLQVGVEEIDNQHRKLYSLLADFYTSLQKGAGKAVSAKMLEDLMSYAGTHFIAEERYLKDHPELVQHRQQHYSFIKRMNQFEREYLHGDIALSVNMVTYIADWLFEHISGTDKLYFRDLAKPSEI